MGKNRRGSEWLLPRFVCCLVHDRFFGKLTDGFTEAINDFFKGYNDFISTALIPSYRSAHDLHFVLSLWILLLCDQYQR